MVYRLYTKVRVVFNKCLVSAYLRRYRFVSREYVMERLGSPYGGWYIPVNLIKPDWICYSGGAGEDISFDVGLHRACGCRLWIFDPTPRAIRHVESNIRGVDGIRFLPIGLWSSNETLKFYAPRNPGHVSHSALNLQKTDRYFEAPCLRLGEILRMLGHDRIDLLKIDIEGAEHAVIEDMLGQSIRPKVLCLEIDQPASAIRCIRTLARIRGAGYRLCAVDGWNYSFVYEQSVAITG